MDSTETAVRHSNKRSTYVSVFVALVVLTAIEVGLTFLNLPRQAVTAVFLILSLGKASLVASFYMHLRDDKPIYTYIFILPAVLLVVFIVMASLY
jgi:caa(3)-type oxidase subunit IV